ncbi:MAG: DUF1614 domain-containing protein [Deltaproteobacteria bacterium]
MFYNPFTALIFFLFVGVFFVLFFFVQIGALTLAFSKIGISPQYMLSLFFLTLVGSAINIPIKRFKEDELCDDRVIPFYGMRYRLPSPRQPCTTTLAINVGGAVIPILMSLYILLTCQVPVRALLATGLMSVVVFRLARPIRGVGIGVPLLVPPLLAALIAFVVSPSNAPPVAYIAGTLGTLIGADLMNLKKITGLGAPVASIGGAGTFDGIFLTGIIAVLLT